MQYDPSLRTGATKGSLRITPYLNVFVTGVMDRVKNLADERATNVLIGSCTQTVRTRLQAHMTGHSASSGISQWNYAVSFLTRTYGTDANNTDQLIASLMAVSCE